jgi:hypothetical protein
MSLYNDLAANLTGSTQQFVRIVHGTQPLFTARRTKGYVLSQHIALLTAVATFRD